MSASDNDISFGLRIMLFAWTSAFISFFVSAFFIPDWVTFFAACIASASALMMSGSYLGTLRGRQTDDKMDGLFFNAFFLSALVVFVCWVCEGYGIHFLPKN